MREGRTSTSLSAEPAAELESSLARRFEIRFERTLGRVWRLVASEPGCADDIQPLVERILVETVDDWMAPGRDPMRDARVLAHARKVISEAG